MFLIEAVPRPWCWLGIAVLWLLPNGPHNAKFLSEEERATLLAVLARDVLLGGAAVGINATLPVFWGRSAALLTGAAAERAGSR